MERRESSTPAEAMHFTQTIPTEGTLRLQPVRPRMRVVTRNDVAQGGSEAPFRSATKSHLRLVANNEQSLDDPEDNATSFLAAQKAAFELAEPWRSESLGQPQLRLVTKDGVALYGDLIPFPVAQEESFEPHTLPHTEQEVAFAVYYERIAALRAVWKSELSRAGIRDTDKKRNYDPVLPRAKFEQLKTDEEREQFRIAEIENVLKSVRERLRTAESRIRISIGEDGKLYNYDLSDEPLETVVARGVYVSRQQGSGDTVREEQELLGFFDRQAALVDPDAQEGEKVQVGRKVIGISGPSSAGGTIYTENFIDIQEPAFDPEINEWYISYVRFASSFSYDQYKTLALSRDPTYFDGFDSEKDTMDAWFLRYPIIVEADEPYKDADDVFAKLFAKDQDAMEEELYTPIQKEYMPFAHHFVYDRLTSDVFDPVSIAEGYHGILVAADKGRKRQEQFVQSHKQYSNSYREVSAKDIRFYVEEYKKETVEELKAGCGTSSGFGFGEKSGNGFAFFANSVAAFGLMSDKHGERAFSCPDCGYINIRPVDELIEECQNEKCKSTNVACAPKKEEESNVVQFSDWKKKETSHEETEKAA